MDEAPNLKTSRKSEEVSSLGAITEALKQTELQYLLIGAPHVKNLRFPKEKCREFFRIQVSNISTASLEDYSEKLKGGELKLEHNRFNPVLSLAIGAIALVSLFSSGISITSTTEVLAFILFCLSLIALGYFSFASSWTNRKTSFLFLIDRELRRRAGGDGPFTPILTDG